jgi:hypothetical protein
LNHSAISPKRTPLNAAPGKRKWFTAPCSDAGQGAFPAGIHGQIVAAVMAKPLNSGHFANHDCRPAHIDKNRRFAVYRVHSRNRYGPDVARRAAGRIPPEQTP